MVRSNGKCLPTSRTKPPMPHVTLDPSTCASDTGNMNENALTKEPGDHSEKPHTTKDVFPDKQVNENVETNKEMKSIQSSPNNKGADPFVNLAASVNEGQAPSGAFTKNSDCTANPFVNENTRALSTPISRPKDPIPPSTPKTQTEIDDYVTDKLHIARNALIESKLYLGDAHFDVSNFSWTRHGTSDLLTQTSSTGENTHIPITLSAVAFITPEDYWLTSCGLWRGTSNFASSLSQVKPSCTGGRPNHDLFAPDFDRTLDNIQALIALGAKAENNGNTRGVLFTGADKLLKIKFRHILFEPISNENALEDDSTDSVPKAFKLENWPAQHPAAQEALKYMVENKTHRVIPLPAYDMHGRLIEPSDYRQRLEGALVQIHFSLIHWYFAPKPNLGTYASDVFAANIVSMRVLVPPRASGPVTPRKRPFYASDPFTPDLHPAKKRATD